MQPTPYELSTKSEPESEKKGTLLHQQRLLAKEFTCSWSPTNNAP